MKSSLFLLFLAVGLSSSCSLETKSSSRLIPTNPQTTLLASDSASGSLPNRKASSSSKQPTSPVPKSGAATKTIYQLLQGKWRSTDDAQYVLELREHHYLDYYGGKLSDSTEFILDKACPSASNAGHPGDNERYLVQLKEYMCWEIVGVDEESLELIYTSRGNSLFFKRIN